MASILLVIALTCYLGGVLYSFFVFAAKATRPSRELLAFAGVGFAMHTAAILAEWWQLGHFPIVNPREVSSFIGWAITAYFLVMRRRYQARALPTFILPLVYLFTLVSMILPETSQAMPATLQTAVTDNPFIKVLFPVHVSLVIFSYAAFVITFVCGVMYLVQERELKAKHFGAAFQRLPALNTCDEIGYRALTIGFVLLTLGVVTGIVWNNQRDGRYWHNDPKEVMALVTWLVYLFIMHYRLTANWRGRRVAWLSIAGFVVVMLTWLGARALGGYHVFG
ncbi:MAG TPA: cytochrome c biogenesis protein CcsA [Blastocatellia bacterium]|nr:cytochrome c biogenesis protein CcsA [Blastocatellia bacterium]HMV86752.1 cytochrome c biogenesis protein CcsA [Blastocatellia bacterium]HMY72420.1 cytochrome c biogenesis protein CcsA [Blastocatellia bacterium]HMZ22729.1 cytochrome c biogenesis protein CcsA [Blastocatellia bacterium]HNG32226.1 cytochrome c biogenesis protein CcsA [Blastocatellia bacterium]